MSMNLTLGEHHEAFIKELVASGRYASHSEAVRAAMRLLQDQEQLRQIRIEDLRAQLQEGIDSGDAPGEWDVEAIKSRGREKLATLNGK